jgi:phosphate transport system substrate-binding protein
MKLLGCTLVGLVTFCGAVAHAATPAPISADNAWHGDLVTARAFMADTATVYAAKQKTKLVVKAINTVAAIEAVSQGRLQVIGSARGPEARAPGEQNLEFTPVAWDALAVLSHPSNAVKALTLAQLRDVFAGRVTNWKQLGGADRVINVYAVAGPLDGVEYSLRRALFGNGAASVAAKRWYINTQQLEDAIAIDPVAIGVSAWSNVHANRGVRAFAIEGVAPSRENVVAGKYALPMPLYLVSRHEAPGQTSSLPLARRIIDFMRTDSVVQTQMRKKQLVTLTEAVSLAAGEDAREAFLVAHLGPRTRLAGPPVKPPPPAPAKNKLTNKLREDDALLTSVALPLPRADAPKSSQRNVLGDPTQTTGSGSDCRPRPMCA